MMYTLPTGVRVFGCNNRLSTNDIGELRILHKALEFRIGEPEVAPDESDIQTHCENAPRAHALTAIQRPRMM